LRIFSCTIEPRIVSVPSGEALSQTASRGKLAAVVSAARSVVGAIRSLALAAAAAALLVWAVLFAGWLQAPAPRPVVSVLMLIVLLTPPAGTGLLVLLLREVMALPARIRELPAEASAAARGVSRARRGGRAASGAMLVWRLVRVMRAGKGTWLRTAGAARLASLASIPAATFMLVSVLVSVGLVVAGVGAVLWLGLRALT
jgi:hypothetical protein